MKGQEQGSGPGLTKPAYQLQDPRYDTWQPKSPQITQSQCWRQSSNQLATSLGVAHGAIMPNQLRRPRRPCLSRLQTAAWLFLAPLSFSPHFTRQFPQYELHSTLAQLVAYDVAGNAGW